MACAGLSAASSEFERPTAGANVNTSVITANSANLPAGADSFTIQGVFPHVFSELIMNRLRHAGSEFRVMTSDMVASTRSVNAPIRPCRPLSAPY